MRPSQSSRPHTTSGSTGRDIRARSPAAPLSPEARILAAADAYQAMSEPRPHRPARPPDDAARELREDVGRGRLDADAVDAVLGAAGHRVPRRREGPAGLTRREVEVLVLLARGLSNKAIAAQLVVSPKTVGHHIEHIYRKIGCSTRARRACSRCSTGSFPSSSNSLEDRANARCSGDPAERTVARMTTASETTLGRLGAWAADHRRLIVIVWGAAVLALGALAPFADRVLSGAGWEAPARSPGRRAARSSRRSPARGTYALSVVVAGERAGIDERPMRATLAGVQRVLRSDRAVSGVLPPQQGVTVSRTGAPRSSPGSRARRRRRWSRRPDG